MNRLSLGSLLRVATCTSLMLSVGCSKSDSPETTASESEIAVAAPTPEATKTAEPARAAEPVEPVQGLEAEIAKPGPKTVTAVGAAGKVKVLDVASTTLAETETYIVKAMVPASTAIGADGVVTINLLPKTGWKINQEFPTKLSVTPPAGISLASATQSAADAKKFAEKGAVFAVKFKADSAGAKAFAADFRFAVCTDATCDPKKAKLAWNMEVK